MGDIISISIPADTEGYVLCQCPLCNSFFKLLVNDYENADEIYCPVCGMKSDSYITNDAIELAKTKIMNNVEEEIFSVFKDLERKTHGQFISIKAGKKPKPEPENPIRNKIEAMEIARFECCDKSCKIKSIFLFTGCYCPFCGVKEYEP